METLFYKPPSDEHFEEVRQFSIRMRQESKFNQDKIDFLNSLDNVGSNFIMMVQKLDMVNQARLAHEISNECSVAIYERLISGGWDSRIIPFKKTING